MKPSISKKHESFTPRIALARLLAISLATLCSGCIEGRKGQPDGGVALDGPAREAALHPDLIVEYGGTAPLDGAGPDALVDEGISGGGSCSENAECGAEEFCNLDYHCGMQGTLGTCEFRPPPGCPILYGPVCGCDDVDYQNACSAHLAGVSVAKDGDCG